MRKTLAGPLIGLAAHAFLGGADLAPEARRLAGILACTVWWWMTEAMPLPAAGLIASSFCVAFGVAPAKRAMASYGDPVIFLFIGSFWIAESMSAHGLDRRLAGHVLSWRWVNASPRRLLIGFGLLAALISMWVSNTATTAMLLPVVLGVLKDLPGSARDPRLESRLLLMLSFAASVGGLGTPVGTPPNLIGIGMLRNLAGIDISFARWCALALPITAASLIFIGFVLSRGIPKPAGWSKLEAELRERRARLGPWSRGEINTALAFYVAVALWLGAPRLPEGTSALLAAGLLFVLPLSDGGPTLTWQRAARADWGTILLFGAGMSLGGLLFDTKLAETLGVWAVGLLGLRTPLGIAALASALALLVSELASNTASANVTVPVALALSKAAGVAPQFPALAATMAASFGFLLPVSTPPNALVYGTGRVPLREMMRYGLLLDIFGLFAVLAGLSLYG
ncbi:MAG: hypothetical protein A2X40_08115 [Elusimicrobia bacterium GWC2_65_9]|nr:MAG: hypothetical protein A2X37_09545 [Elusimicrobia bacterium GWA2_66_18]OGR73127.1 MAG: hypothetical protein A2X40_08115 [Elusimicrobia bacterium GWC2_65_9]